MRRIFFLWSFLLFFLCTSSVGAFYDPRSVANNHFGIHIIDENDLTDADKLLNSSGGDWGYVKLVIREDDRNRDKWQEVFDKMRRNHLIPIVRLATKVERGNWVKPRVEDIGSWVDFLNSLNWVMENRYIVIFNEPNHAKEWGGEINPEEYGWYLKEFSRRLKSASPDFFILPAGLDASAPNSSETLDEAQFVSRMHAKENDVFEFIDGWTSHSYPNPGFVGSATATGRGSVRTFEWEQELLRSYNVNNLPIFILETGWQHSEGKTIDRTLPTVFDIANRYEYAFQNVWNRENIVAVTPFLINYQDAPFDHFSWKKIDSSEFHPMFERIQQLGKTSGQPKQRVGASILPVALPSKLVSDSQYTFFLDLENTGQTIINQQDGWKIVLLDLPTDFQTIISEIENVEPFHRTRVSVNLRTSNHINSYTMRFGLYFQDQLIDSIPFELTLVPPPSLLVRAQVWFNRLARDDDFSLVVYDKKERVLHERTNLTFSDGVAEVTDLKNIIPGQRYRLVLLRPYYLPQQIHADLGETKTAVSFPPLLPLDPSSDGKLDMTDIGAFLSRPLDTLGLMLNL